MNCNARSNAQFNGLDFYALICQLAIKFGLNPTLTIPNTFLMTPKDGQLCLINQSNLLVDLKKKGNGIANYCSWTCLISPNAWLISEIQPSNGI